MEKLFDEKGKLIKASSYVSPIQGFNTEVETMETAYSDGFKEGIKHTLSILNSFIWNTELSTHNVNYTDVMKYNEGVLSLHKYTINKLKEEGYEFNW